MLLFSLVVSLLFLIILINRLFHQHNNPLPPSPTGSLPIVGHLWKLNSRKPFLTVDSWSRKYGDIITVNFGTTPVIILSRERLLRKAFLGEAENFSGRPKLFVHESCWGKGLIISDGNEQKELKKFLATFLRAQKDSTSHGIQQAIDVETRKMLSYIEELRASTDNHINIEDVTLFVMGNVLTSFLLGRTYSHGSHEFK
ncbi:hypothetical protein AB6A40_009855 [Gnathostoma spinigerum]|uniref:Cytochrome P450 n=1 Tax=Gnathostoma spinigerum TaxID=75299 RepID=A0ABD6EUX9_9BILA